MQQMKLRGMPSKFLRVAPISLIAGATHLLSGAPNAGAGHLAFEMWVS